MLLNSYRLTREVDMVLMGVEDNEPSMNEDVRKRIFKLFFTTKAVGTGTGLRLSVSYFIVKENRGGTMSMESLPRHSAHFSIRLPFAKT